MKSVRVSVSLRPKVYQWVKEQVALRQMSISRYIATCVEEALDRQDRERARLNKEHHACAE